MGPSGECGSHLRVKDENHPREPLAARRRGIPTQLGEIEAEAAAATSTAAASITSIVDLPWEMGRLLRHAQPVVSLDTFVDFMGRVARRGGSLLF
jgi:hypothetical protein